MPQKKEFRNLFLVLEKKEPVTRKTMSGRLQSKQELVLRDLFPSNTEGAHTVLFYDSSLVHLETIQPGDVVNLTFILHAGTSTSGINHTNLVPRNISKYEKAL
jgi:hypothetical protein